jgi:hypothetical protein
MMTLTQDKGQRDQDDEETAGQEADALQVLLDGCVIRFELGDGIKAALGCPTGCSRLSVDGGRGGDGGSIAFGDPSCFVFYN